MVANEAEGRAEASRRVAACHAAQAEELDLGGLQLTALDGELLEALCQLGWLRRLFLGLSAEVREKPQLAFVDGEKNPKLCNALGALPGALFDALTRLAQLDLAHNRLRGLPASIANLTSLTSLHLWDNKIGAEGAQALKGLVNLTSLDLAGNTVVHARLLSEIVPGGAAGCSVQVFLDSPGVGTPWDAAAISLAHDPAAQAAPR
jgi:Leucine-rich repeat (LRR) protein